MWTLKSQTEFCSFTSDVTPPLLTLHAKTIIPRVLEGQLHVLLLLRLSSNRQHSSSYNIDTYPLENCGSQRDNLCPSKSIVIYSCPCHGRIRKVLFQCSSLPPPSMPQNQLHLRDSNINLLPTSVSDSVAPVHLSSSRSSTNSSSGTLRIMRQPRRSGNNSRDVRDWKTSYFTLYQYQRPTFLPALAVIAVEGKRKHIPKGCPGCAPSLISEVSTA